MTHKPYSLAVAAGIALSLGFPPSPLWPMVLPGMALYFYCVMMPSRSTWDAWWTGFIPGAMLGLWLAYTGLAHMMLLPGATVFSYLVHVSPFVIALLFGDVFGAVALLYRALGTRSVLVNSLLGAALYTLGEMLQQFIWQGYYWGSLAHPFANFAPALAVAALGGTFLVSFLIAWAACAVVQPRFTGVLIFCAVFLVLYGAGLYAGRPTVKTGSVSIAVVQATEQDFSFAQSNGLADGVSAQRFKEAGHSGADLVIYPYSPAEGALYEGPEPPPEVRYEPVVAPLSALSAWVSEAVLPTSTAFVWQSVYDSTKDQFYETFHFFKNGAGIATYNKQRLYPFTDYFPAWMLSLGLVQRNDSLTPGAAAEYTQVGAWRIGALDCSEIDQTTLVRDEARGSDFLLSVGSDALFQNSGPAQYSLSAARYRAAENHISVVRAALLGSSAIIRPDGSLQTYLPNRARGILYGSVAIYAPRQTPYNRLGDLPVFAVAAGILLLGAWRRYGRYRL